MSAFLLVVVMLIYFSIAIDQTLNGTAAMAIVYVGYAVANIGLIMALR